MDRKPGTFPKTLKIFLLAISCGVLLVVCLGVGLAVDSFHMQHEQAAARWEQRQPYHYRYTVQVDGSFFTSKFRIEVRNKKIVHIMDANTGETAQTWRMAPGSYLIETGLIQQYIAIDRIFDQIQAGRKPPRTWTAFLYRLDPVKYTFLVDRDLLPRGSEGCDPAFPTVSYHPYFGYPEELTLGGNPCTMINELRNLIFIWITGF
jgi:hypothetical protein